MNYKRDMALAEYFYSVYMNHKKGWKLDEWCTDLYTYKDSEGSNTMCYKDNSRTWVFYCETANKVNSMCDNTIYIDQYIEYNRYNAKGCEYLDVTKEEFYFMESLLHTPEEMQEMLLVKYFDKKRCSPFYINTSYFSTEIEKILNAKY